jgi:hypothetical protein
MSPMFWAQLTELQVGICGTEPCLGALMWSPNLVTLGVTLVEARPQVRPMVQLSKPIQLEILAYEDPGYLFDHLTLPFRDFKCEYGSTSVLVWSRGQFVSLLTRSSSSLEKLSIGISVKLNKDHLLQLLEMSSNLVELNIYRRYANRFSPGVMARLTNQRPLDGKLWPCLMPKLRII